MKIAICDDDIKDIERLKSHIRACKAEHEVVEFLSAIPFLKQIEEGEQFGLLFLDVQMPDADGWKIAKQLKQSKVKIYIVMVTVIGDYVFDCFDRVDWFAQKPVSMEKAHLILEKAQEKLFPKVFQFMSDKLPVELTAPEIKYIEVIRNHSYIYSAFTKYKVRMSLNEIKKLFSNMPCFVQTHQSYIINLDYYDEIDGNNILLKNGVRIPISRGNKKVFFDSLAEYIRDS